MERLHSHCAASTSHSRAPASTHLFNHHHHHWHMCHVFSSRPLLQRRAPGAIAAAHQDTSASEQIWGRAGGRRTGSNDGMLGGALASAPTPSTPGPSLQPLDMAYIQDVYKVRVDMIASGHTYAACTHAENAATALLSSLVTASSPAHLLRSTRRRAGCTILEPIQSLCN